MNRSKQSSGKSSSSDGSFVFSLAELSRMEGERLRREAEEAQARTRALELARLDAEATRAESERRARAAELEAREAAALREREARAREEATRAAAIEAARVKAELEARAAETARRHAHELEVARLGVEHATHARRRSALSMLAGGVLVAAALLGVQLGLVQPRADAQTRALEVAVSDQAKAADDTRAELAKERQDNEGLSRELSSANDRAANAEAELAAAKNARPGRTSGFVPSTTRGETSTTTTTTATNHDLDGTAVCGKDDGDPQCVHHGA